MTHSLLRLMIDIFVTSTVLVPATKEILSARKSWEIHACPTIMINCPAVVRCIPEWEVTSDKSICLHF